MRGQWKQMICCLRLFETLNIHQLHFLSCVDTAHRNKCAVPKTKIIKYLSPRIFFLGGEYILIDFSLTAGDEILEVNGEPLKGYTHQKAILKFRQLKHGTIILKVRSKIPR